MIKNSINSYGVVAKSFHWIMAGLFVGMFVVAYIMINIPKSGFRYSLYDVHKANGILLFGLVILRLVWRFINIKPVLTIEIPAWQGILAKMNNVLLYSIMIVMPMTGILTSTLGGHEISFYGIFVIAPFWKDAALSDFYSNVHEILSYIFIGSFILHVAGALYHQYVLKDGILRRMLASHH